MRAASSRPWPARMPPCSSTSTGLVQPNSTMLAAIWSTCASLCVRGLRSYGRRRSIGHSSIRSASATSRCCALSARAGRTVRRSTSQQSRARVGLRVGVRRRAGGVQPLVRARVPETGCPRAARSRRCRPRQRRRSGPDRPAPARGRRCSGRRVRSSAARPAAELGSVKRLRGPEVGSAMVRSSVVGRHAKAACGGSGESSCEPEVRTATRRSGASQAGDPGIVPEAEAGCGFQAAGCDGWCELRTRNAACR